jgi:hypothetical protein
MTPDVIFKVGMLVLCQFTITQKTVVNPGQTDQPVVERIRQMTGTVRSIRPKILLVPEMRDGKMVAVTKKSTLLEIDGDHPGWHYFLKTTACVGLTSEKGVSMAVDELPEPKKTPTKVHAPTVKQVPSAPDESAPPSTDGGVVISTDALDEDTKARPSEAESDSSGSEQTTMPVVPKPLSTRQNDEPTVSPAPKQGLEKPKPTAPPIPEPVRSPDPTAAPAPASTPAPAAKPSQPTILDDMLNNFR